MISLSESDRLKLEIYDEELEGVREDSSDYFLGAIRVAKTFPSFSNGYNWGVTARNGFGKFYDAVGRRWILTYRLNQHRNDEAMVLGWVRPEREPELDAWIEFMNKHLAYLLTLPSSGDLA